MPRRKHKPTPRPLFPQHSQPSPAPNTLGPAPSSPKETKESDKDNEAPRQDHLEPRQDLDQTRQDRSHPIPIVSPVITEERPSPGSNTGGEGVHSGGQDQKGDRTLLPLKISSKEALERIVERIGVLWGSVRGDVRDNEAKGLIDVLVGYREEVPYAGPEVVAEKVWEGDKRKVVGWPLNKRMVLVEGKSGPEVCWLAGVKNREELEYIWVEEVEGELRSVGSYGRRGVRIG